MADKNGRRAPDRRPSRLGYIGRSTVNRSTRRKAFGRWLEHRLVRRRAIVARVFASMDPQSLFTPTLGADAGSWPIWKIRRYTHRHGFNFGLASGRLSV